MRAPLRPDAAKAAQVRAELGLDQDNLPLSLSPEERAAALQPGEPEHAMAPQSQSLTPEVSPTGKPFISPKAVPWLMLVVAALSAVAMKQPDLFPATELDQQIAVIVISVLGFLSPGLRTR